MSTFLAVDKTLEHALNWIAPKVRDLRYYVIYREQVGPYEYYRAEVLDEHDRIVWLTGHFETTAQVRAVVLKECPNAEEVQAI